MVEFDFPDVLFKLTTDNTKVLKKWLCNRYTRATFPDEFNNRLAKSRVSKFIEKSFSSKVSHDWLVKIQPTVIPELKFGKAINYALNSWEHILNYIECPEIYLDNSIAERSIKPFVLGRKNWLFAGSEDGARSSCLLFSLIECAKIQGINPEDYLRCIFEQAIDTETWTEDDWKNLLTWNIKITSFIPQGIWISSKRVEN